MQIVITFGGLGEEGGLSHEDGIDWVSEADEQLEVE